MYHIDSAYIPVDFSDHAGAAYAFARRLNPSTITVGHLLDDWAPHVRNVLFPYAALGEDDVEFEHELIDEARIHLQSHLELDDETSLAVDIGRTPDALNDEIRSLGPDAVIMGAFGEGGARPDALGSTARRVLDGASCPVILIRHFGGPPRVERVVAAVDLSANATGIIAHALGVALQLDADLELVYVLPDPLRDDTTRVLAQNLDVDVDALQEAARHRVEALFEQRVDQVDVDFPKKERAQALLEQRAVLFGDPAMTLVDYAAESDADLVVVGSRRREQTRRNVGRVARAVAASCPTHIMVVPAV